MHVPAFLSVKSIFVRVFPDAATPGLRFPSKLHHLWCRKGPQDVGCRCPRHQQLSSPLTALDSLPVLEAMTACEKSGQWFPALRILVTPQVGNGGQLCGGQ